VRCVTFKWVTENYSSVVPGWIRDVLSKEGLEMDFFYSIAGFFSSGGLFMFPILLVFAVGLGIAIERYFTLSMVTNKNQQV
jgi:hypothetical protein